MKAVGESMLVYYHDILDYGVRNPRLTGAQLNIVVIVFCSIQYCYHTVHYYLSLGLVVDYLFRQNSLFS